MELSFKSHGMSELGTAAKQATLFFSSLLVLLPSCISGLDTHEIGSNHHLKETQYVFTYAASFFSVFGMQVKSSINTSYAVQRLWTELSNRSRWQLVLTHQ